MSKETAKADDTVGLHRKLKKEETVVGGRRSIKKDADLEIIGSRRDAKKIEAEQAEEKALEIDIAAPHKAIEYAERKKLRRRSGKQDWRIFLALTATTLVLIALTMAAFFLLERYQPAGDAFLDDQPFAAGFPGWEQKGDVTLDPDDPGSATLRNDDPESRSFLKRVIDLPPADTLVFLKATASTEKVAAGADLWQRARIYFVQRDEEGIANWNEPHNLFRLRGTTAPLTVSQVFPVPASVSQAVLSLEVNNATGQMTISDLELYPVEEKPGFQKIAMGLMVAWAILGLIAATVIFTSIPSDNVRIALGAMLALFAFGLFMPVPVHDAIVAWMNIPFSGESGLEPDIIGHGVVFAIMAFTVRIGRPDDPIWLHLGCWALIAVASETLQLFTFDRRPSVADFVVDGIGFVIGLLAATYLPGLYARSVFRP